MKVKIYDKTQKLSSQEKLEFAIQIERQLYGERPLVGDRMIFEEVLYLIERKTFDYDTLKVEFEVSLI